MQRLKLFLFFTAMAWVSAINPRHGKAMIEAAERDAKQQAFRRLVQDIHRNGRAEPEPEDSGPSVGLMLFGTLAALSTIGWVVILVGMAFGGE